MMNSTERENEPISEIEPTPTGQMVATPTQIPVRASRLNWLGPLLRNPKAIIGVLIVLFFVVVAILAPLLWPGDPNDFVDSPRLHPSAEHLLGTTGQGQDLLGQMIWATRTSLTIGLLGGVATTFAGRAVGMSAGDFGRGVDDSW